VEVIYEGNEMIGNMRALLDETVAGTGMEILRVRNNRILEHALKRMTANETLEDLDTTDVFKRCLEAHEIPEEKRSALMDAYREILVSLNEQDLLADVVHKA
jgi:exonuclease SbcD